MRRLVVDPNVLVSGIAGRTLGAPPALLMMAIRNESFETVACPHLMSEVRKALRKPYFRGRIAEGGRESALAALETAATMLADPTDVRPLLRDPADDYLVALARESGAEAIVSGDKDLLDHPDLEPPAIDARSACRLLGLFD